MFAWTATAGAGEVTLVGNVVTLAPENGELTLRLPGSGKLITVVDKSARHIDSIQTGAALTIRGKFYPQDPTRFSARTIQPLTPSTFNPDPTGVRSRLFKAKGLP